MRIQCAAATVATAAACCLALSREFEGLGVPHDRVSAQPRTAPR